MDSSRVVLHRIELLSEHEILFQKMALAESLKPIPQRVKSESTAVAISDIIKFRPRFYGVPLMLVFSLDRIHN